VEPDFLTDPRVQGIREHYTRAVWFQQEAHTVKSEEGKFRLLMAALYSCRAFVEIMLEAVEQQQVQGFKHTDAKESRRKFEETIIPNLSRYYLVEKIRIHDFHRMGLLPPDPALHRSVMSGPIKLTASKGGAGIQETPTGPRTWTTGNSQIKLQRSLYIQGDRFFDDEKSEYVSLETIIGDFVRALRAVGLDFQKMLGDRVGSEAGKSAS
jgi:hypothetical protein